MPEMRILYVIIGTSRESCHSFKSSNRLMLSVAFSTQVVQFGDPDRHTEFSLDLQGVRSSAAGDIMERTSFPLVTMGPMASEVLVLAPCS